LAGRDRLHPEPPAVAAPIVIRKLTLDQGCIPTNGSEMRLRPLDSFLNSGSGVHGKQTPAACLEQPYQGHRSDRERHDDLE
jgi:hypothetical protein